MLRRNLAAALVAGALFVPFSEAAAQDPLRIYCSSPTQDYCMSILTYDAVFGVGQANWSSVVQLYGSGYEGAVTGGVFMRTWAYIEDGCRIGLFDTESLNGPGHYGLGDSSGGCSPTTAAARPPSVDDIAEIGFVVGAAPATFCTPGVSCVEVPEPSTYLLLLTSLGGVGLVAWRRRKEETLA